MRGGYGNSEKVPVPLPFLTQDFSGFDHPSPSDPTRTPQVLSSLVKRPQKELHTITSKTAFANWNTVYPSRAVGINGNLVPSPDTTSRFFSFQIATLNTLSATASMGTIAGHATRRNFPCFSASARVI